jgi:hypothetical protein
MRGRQAWAPPLPPRCAGAPFGRAYTLPWDVRAAFAADGRFR